MSAIFFSGRWVKFPWYSWMTIILWCTYVTLFHDTNSKVLYHCDQRYTNYHMEGVWMEISHAGGSIESRFINEESQEQPFMNLDLIMIGTP